MIDELKALRIEVASIRAERDRLETAARAYIEGHERAMYRAETAEQERDAARAEVQRLRGILDRYGCHTLSCAWNTSDDDAACDCGLSAALATGGDRG